MILGQCFSGNEKPPTEVDGCRERRGAGARYTTMMTTLVRRSIGRTAWQAADLGVNRIGN
jgi:hypothetical protein